jgi:hypothetical protein
MIRRAWYLAATLTIAIVSGACVRTETSNAPVTSTSPAGTSTAPSSDSAKHRDEALLRAVQATPTGNNLDLFAGDLLLFDGLAFKSVTGYRALDGQRYAFGLRPAGMTRAKPLSLNSEDLKDGEFYTAFAMPEGSGGSQLRVVVDDHDAPASGKARLRVVNAGIDAGVVDLRSTGSADPFVNDVDYQAITSYADVPPLNGVVEIVSDRDGKPVLATVNLHLEAGRFYTIVIVGSPSSTPKYEAFLIEDKLSP